ncbi:uncharacterized protein LOC101854727 [Aplysia californica]|uniref:Uncharacterized protein LOC101854727 n=1 Tax=Aplysia californica TaxID=6500 RepID=A0ABM0JTL6_APLCA|nr:uncharacterized protein LOC101854727 [Aplysia californica]
MSDSCEELELEGDVEEFEGDEFWETLKEANPESTQKGNDKNKEPAVQKVEKSSVKHESHTVPVPQEASPTVGSKNSGQRGVKSADSDTKKKLVSKKANVESTRTVEKQGSNVDVSTLGDIANAITSIDSFKAEYSVVKEKIHYSSEDLGIKRKPVENVSSSSPKVRKIHSDSKASPKQNKSSSDSGRNVFAAVEDQKCADKENKSVEEQEIVDDIMVTITEEESKAIDTILAEEMFEDIRQCAQPKTEEKTFTLRFGPVEIADLAESGMQNLIRSQPSLSFYFRRQAGKFKKKKGYGEICFLRALPIQAFIRRLCLVKLVEKRIELTISVQIPKGRDYVGTLVLRLDRHGKLLKLIGSGDEPVRGTATPSKTYFEVDQVPIDAHPLSLKTLFPFIPFIDMKNCIEDSGVKPAFKGPVRVCYADASWLEAVLECFSEFTINNHPLAIRSSIKTEVGEGSQAQADHEMEDAANSLQRQSSTQSCSEQESDPIKEHQDSPENRLKETEIEKSVWKEEESDNGEVSKDEGSADEEEEDDDISNMTRDVCADMLESLNKLKQLETDNPNVQKILEMQVQLAKLQKSLSKPVQEKRLSTDESEKDTNPWTVETIDEKKEITCEISTHGKRTVKVNKNEVLQAEKKRMEMESLQKRIDDAEKSERQKEEMTKQMREKELKARREFEEKRRANWAKKMIEDLKKGGQSVSVENSAAKKEAQKLLEAREQKLKLQKEAEMEKAQPTQDLMANKKEESQHPANDLKDGIAQIILPFQEIISSTSVGKFDFMRHSAGAEPTSSKLGISSLDKGAESASSHSGNVEANEPSSRLETEEETQVVEITEIFYKEMMGKTSVLPQKFQVTFEYSENRSCPVQSCSAKRYYKSEEEFVDHWQIFHKQNMTVRFCPKCSAYFSNQEELLDHLKARHSIHEYDDLMDLLKKVRTKVIRNPSFRDPTPFSFVQLKDDTFRA